MLKSPVAAPHGAAPRQLIINADDFGYSDATNRGIIQCRRHGVLTSASLMVLAPAAAQAAQYAADDPELSLGLHLELGEWALRADQWVQTKVVVPLEDSSAVKDEIQRQLTAFRQWTGQDPTHLDSHQHVHQRLAVKTIMREVADNLGVVLRGDSDAVRFLGAFYGQDQHLQMQPEYISVVNLLRLLDQLQPGITELSCHPGLDTALDSTYRDERLLEVRTLCDPEIRNALERKTINLISFKNLAATQ